MSKLLLVIFKLLIQSVEWWPKKLKLENITTGTQTTDTTHLKFREQNMGQFGVLQLTPVYKSAYHPSFEQST